MTNQLLPAKLLREWTALFTAGHDLYEQGQGEPVSDPSQPTPEQILEEEKQLLLDEGDFNEYRVSQDYSVQQKRIDLVTQCSSVLICKTDITQSYVLR